MDRHLPFVPEAQPGESPLSLLRRGAAGNGHRSTLRFAFALNPSIDHSQAALGTVARNPGVYRSTCKQMGLEDSQFSDASYRRQGRAERDKVIWMGRAVGVGDLQFRRAKLCVACYVEDGYARAAWDHVAAVACARHAVLLDDACPCCRKPWTADRDPFACGCSPEQMMAHQERCDAESAASLNEWIDEGDAQSASVAAGAWRTIGYWAGMGMRLSRTLAAAALAALLRGRWPDGLPSDPVGVRLHPRVAVAPLLASHCAAGVAAGKRLLEQAAPPIVVSGVASLSWPAAHVEALLGVGRLAVRRLADAGHLTRCRDGTITAASVNDLLWLTSGQDEPPASGRTIAELRGGRIRIALHNVISLIRAGEITSFQCRPSRGLGGLVCTMDLKSHAAATDHLSVLQAAAQLEVNSESIRRHIHLGLLPATRGTARSSVEWSISADALAGFSHLYVFASTIAARNGAPLRTISSRLRSAGLSPVSGPGIDGGVTYLFRRADIECIDLASVLTGPYHSPAGRRRGYEEAFSAVLWDGRQTAEHLALSVRKLREVIRGGWLAPAAIHRRRQMFERSAVEALRLKIDDEFMTLASAAHQLGQSIPQFRKTWVESGLVAVQSWAGMPLVSRLDLSRVEAIWRERGTAASIAANLKRSRWLCPNLEKLSRIEAPLRLGIPGKSFRLYSRADRVLEHYVID